MNRLDASYQELVAREAVLREARRRKQAVKMPSKSHLKPLPSPRELLERIASKTKAASRGCVEYTGHLNWGGYGKTSFGGESLVHRLVWRLLVGAIPKDRCVLHTCDNPSCINIAHLFLGTNADNVRDRVLKGRNYAKLKWKQVEWIRCYAEMNRLDNGRLPRGTLAFLARKYNVADTSILRVILWRKYKYPPMASAT